MSTGSMPTHLARALQRVVHLAPGSSSMQSEAQGLAVWSFSSVSREIVTHDGEC